MPDAGRWASRDPLGMANGPNSHSYGLANPVLYSDPTGLIVPLILAALAGAGLGALSQKGCGGPSIALGAAIGGGGTLLTGLASAAAGALELGALGRAAAGGAVAGLTGAAIPHLSGDDDTIAGLTGAAGGAGGGLLDGLFDTSGWGAAAGAAGSLMGSIFGMGKKKRCLVD